MKKLILLLALAVCAFGQIPFNSRGAWQAATLYTVGDTFTCSANSYYVAATYVSGASCLLSNTGTADLVQLNYSAIGSVPDEVLSLSYPRLVNNFYFLQQHMHDTQTYNDWLQISTPSAPSAGKLRVYAKSNSICVMPPGGPEICPGGAGGSTGDYQVNSSGGFVGGFIKQDANGPYSSRALSAATSVVTFSSTPTFDAALGNRFELTLTGNVTSSTWSHLRAGSKFSVAAIQDGTGSHSLVWPTAALNACSPWQVANSVTTVDFEVASDGSTVYAKGCSVYDPANPGVVFYGLMRGSIPTPAASNLACGFDSSSTTWKCVAPDGSVSTAVKSLPAASHNFITSLSVNGVLAAAQPSSQDLSDVATVNTRSFGVTIDGSATPLTAGQAGYVTVPYACTITGWSAQADQSGSIAVDIDKHAAAIPNTTTDKISASAPPTLSSAQLAQSTTLTGWTTAVAANDVVGFNITSSTTVTRVTVSVNCRI